MGKSKRKNFVKQNRNNLSTHKHSVKKTMRSSVQAEYPNCSGFWLSRWQTLGQSWRTEPEIDAKRQIYLAKCYTTIPDIAEGIYPFKNVKLNRADVEWLLATYGSENVDCSDEQQIGWKGLDLRGADLRGIDLSNLLLVRVLGGLTGDEIGPLTIEQREAAAVHLEKAKLCGAHLEEAYLCGAHLEEANMSDIHLENADLFLAHLEGTHLLKAHLEGADISRARLEGASLSDAHLEGAHLFEAHLDKGRMSGAHLEGKLMSINDLARVRKWVKNFPSTLPPADLRRAFLNTATNFGNAIFGEEKFGFVLLADVHWSDANLSIVNWPKIKMLGDERLAREHEITYSKVADTSEQLNKYLGAVRANRQLSTVLQSQGLNEEAARFAYRAEKLQRIVLHRQGRLGQYLFSLFLDLLTGYGYKPMRSFITYLLVICLFMMIYHVLSPQLLWNEALVISMTAFHGRGFFPDTFSPGDPLALVSAIEAFVGLIIEVTFIATLTQRLFRK